MVIVSTLAAPHSTGSQRRAFTSLHSAAFNRPHSAAHSTGLTTPRIQQAHSAAAPIFSAAHLNRLAAPRIQQARSAPRIHTAAPRIQQVSQRQHPFNRLTWPSLDMVIVSNRPAAPRISGLAAAAHSTGLQRPHSTACNAAHSTGLQRRASIQQGQRRQAFNGLHRPHSTGSQRRTNRARNAAQAAPTYAIADALGMT
jgi:hypothetical protein